MDLFDHLIRSTTSDGNIHDLQYGIVANTEDPLKLQRLQVYDSAKGGKFKSGWLLRGLPFTQFSPPVPKLGDLVIFGYIGGDPHMGCYLGVVVNKQNKPVGSDEDFTIVLGSARVTIKASSGDVTVETKGSITATTTADLKVKATKVIIESTEELTLKTPKLKIDSADIDLGTPGSAKLAGKSLTVEGARDNRGDTIVNKGW